MAQTLRELETFLLCEELMKVVEAETANAPAARQFRFCDQLNDASLDAASDVAEGFVRYYPGEFARFLDFAIASLQEIRTRTEAGYRRRWFSIESTSRILNLWARSDAACRSLRAYLRTVRKEDLPPRPRRERPQLRRRRPRVGNDQATLKVRDLLEKRNLAIEPRDRTPCSNPVEPREGTSCGTPCSNLVIPGEVKRTVDLSTVMAG
jgi:four helix bundle protein